MANGFEINISESDFKGKSDADQKWILFSGIVSLKECHDDLQKNGCEYAKKTYKGFKLKMAGAIASGITGALGLIYLIWTIIPK